MIELERRLAERYPKWFEGPQGRLARPLADDSNAALLQLQERQPHLRQRRQEVDKVLARRPVLFDENAIFGWKLSVGTWQDAIDKVLRLDASSSDDPEATGAAWCREWLALALSPAA